MAEDGSGHIETLLGETMHTGGVTAWTSPAQSWPAERKFVQGFGRLRKGENGRNGCSSRNLAQRCCSGVGKSARNQLDEFGVGFGFGKPGNHGLGGFFDLLLHEGASEKVNTVELVGFE